jgi:hypothetical protein
MTGRRTRERDRIGGKTLRTVLVNGEEISSGQGFFIGQRGIPSLCSKRMQNSQLFVNGRYEQSWTY